MCALNSRTSACISAAGRSMSRVDAGGACFRSASMLLERAPWAGRRRRSHTSARSAGRSPTRTRGFLLCLARPATVSSLRPRLRIVSIMPGIDTAAPERTDTSSGLSAPPNILPVAASSRCRAASTCVPEPGRELPGLEVGDADGAGDGEAGRDRNADVGHLGEPGALAAEEVLHGGGAVGAALAEEVDERLGHATGHAGLAVRGDACRSWTIGVGNGGGVLAREAGVAERDRRRRRRPCPRGRGSPRESTPR